MSRSQQAIAVLTRPVAWQGRVAVWMILLAVALFAGNQWLRLRSEIASGVVTVGGNRRIVRPVQVQQEPRIARQAVRHAPKGQEVAVSPLLLSDRQREALEKRFDLDFDAPGQPKREVLFTGKTGAAPQGGSVIVTATSEGPAEVVFKANPPRFLELGPWTLDVGATDGASGVVALGKDLRIGKVWAYGRASTRTQERTLRWEAGARLRF